MALERHNPDSVYQPYKDWYTQTIAATGDKHVYVAGTVSKTEDGELVHLDDLQGQIRHVLRSIDRSLQDHGGDLSDIARMVIYTTDVERFMQEQCGGVIAEEFDRYDVPPPTTTTFECVKLADSFYDVADGEYADRVAPHPAPHYLVEIDAIALIDEE